MECFGRIFKGGFSKNFPEGVGIPKIRSHPLFPISNYIPGRYLGVRRNSEKGVSNFREIKCQ